MMESGAQQQLQCVRVSGVEFVQILLIVMFRTLF